jgi:hypothetical protein
MQNTLNKCNTRIETKITPQIGRKIRVLQAVPMQ